jgi:hypothetical protein
MPHCGKLQKRRSMGRQPEQAHAGDRNADLAGDTQWSPSLASRGNAHKIRWHDWQRLHGWCYWPCRAAIAQNRGSGTASMGRLLGQRRLTVAAEPHVGGGAGAPLRCVTSDAGGAAGRISQFVSFETLWWRSPTSNAPPTGRCNYVCQTCGYIWKNKKKTHRRPTRRDAMSLMDGKHQRSFRSEQSRENNRADLAQQ